LDWGFLPKELGVSNSKEKVGIKEGKVGPEGRNYSPIIINLILKREELGGNQGIQVKKILGS